MPDKEFPTTEAGVNALLQTMAIQLPLVAAQLVLAGGDVDFVVEQSENYPVIMNLGQDISDQKEAFTTWKRSIFKGDPTKPAPTPPVFPVITLPQDAANGIETELRAIIQRIKGSPGYNDTIGEQLGLVDSGPAPFNPDDLTPTLKLAAKPGSIVEIAFVKGQMTGMRVEWQRKGEVSWQLAVILFSSPGQHSAPPAVPDEPEQRSYRAVYIKGNDPIGPYSPIYTVVTTP